MSYVMFEILFGGAETTVQDLGRSGRYGDAICPSGAQDDLSFRVGNFLLKNRENAAGLEITVIGPQIRVQEDTVVAFTGADIPPRINGKEVDLWKTVRVKSGDVITFGPLRSGCRAYLCVAGGIDVPLVFGSRSTGTLSRIGGYEGRKLQKGDPVKTLKPEFPLEQLEGVSLPKKYIPSVPRDVKLRTIRGMYDYRLTRESMAEFFQATWTVAPDSNRVTYRFKGPKFAFKPRPQPFGAGSHPSNVVDIPYPIGSIQLPGGQFPLLLLNDGVTGGGYATIGTVIRSDLDVVGQLKPGDKVIFKSIGIAEALRIRKRKILRISKIKKALEYPF
jgi:biotin-dependent carboxylase-like uncharacterized protein